MPPSIDGLPAPRKYWALAAALLSVSMAVLEGSITNIALPSIAKSFDILPAEAVWITNTYQLAVVVALLPMAALGEIFTYRRVFWWGLLGFVAASAACALTSSFAVLLACRVVQGLAGAAMMGVTSALLRFTYSQKEYGRAIGYTALVVALSSAAGPLLGSFILSVSSWPWLFAVNVPIGLFVLAIGGRMLPGTDPAKRPFDWISALYSTVFFGLVVVGLDRLLLNPKASIAMLCGAAVACVLLVRRGLKQAQPMLPLDLLAIRPFSFSLGASVSTFAGYTAGFVSLPFYYQQVLARSQMETGMLIVPWPILVGVVAPIAVRVSEVVPPAILCAFGSGIVTVCLLVVAALPVDASNGVIMACMALGGAGFGCFQSPNNRVMLTAAPRNRSGSAGGIQATARQLGMSLGAASAALAFTAVPARGPLAGLFVGAALALVGAGVSLFRGAKPPAG